MRAEGQAAVERLLARLGKPFWAVFHVDEQKCELGVLRGGHLYAEAQLALLLVDVENGPEGLPESRQQPLDGGLPLGPHRDVALGSFVCCFRPGSGGYETELCAGLYAPSA